MPAKDEARNSYILSSVTSLVRGICNNNQGVIVQAGGLLVCKTKSNSDLLFKAELIDTSKAGGALTFVGAATIGVHVTR
jgi:hypothetical protein